MGGKAASRFEDLQAEDSRLARRSNTKEGEAFNMIGTLYRA